MDQTSMEFENQVFKKESLTGSDLKKKVFSYVTFENCDFSKSDFTGSRLMECQLQGCNLSLVKINGTRLQKIGFENCKFVGVNFALCDKQFLSVTFKKCLINTCNFSDLDLKNTSFNECLIRETYFSQTNLTGASFADSDLKESIFHNTILNKADFRGAINYSINPLTNKLAKARFSQPEVLTLLHHLDIIIE